MQALAGLNKDTRCVERLPPLRNVFATKGDLTVSKKFLITAVTVVALAGLALVGLQLAGAPEAAAAQTTPTPEAVVSNASVPRLITVVGVGRTSVEPDIATASVGVEELAPTVQEATAAAAANMEAIMAALTELGIAERDIQTSNYSIYFERFPMDATARTTAESLGNYRVSNMVTVKIRDLDQIGEVMDAVIEAGANNIWGINFTVEDRTAGEADARSLAVENARERAAELAELSGVTLGEVLQVSEVIGQASPVYATRDSAAVGLGGGAAGPISPGELEMVTQVQVTFAIQ
jgi:uncharacterized protein